MGPAPGDAASRRPEILRQERGIAGHAQHMRHAGQARAVVQPGQDARQRPHGARHGIGQDRPVEHPHEPPGSPLALSASRRALRRHALRDPRQEGPSPEGQQGLVDPAHPPPEAAPEESGRGLGPRHRHYSKTIFGAERAGPAPERFAQSAAAISR